MIEVEGLTKQYGQARAVDNLTFQVKPGVVTGFLGPNGAGKSTTMRMILGLDRPTAGTATINGTNYRNLRNPLHTVGALLDAKAIHPARSARNHLKWVAHSNGIATKRVDEVLELVGLSSVAKKKIGGFSLGMGQRLGLATALLGDPEILILDEPVNGLDPEGIQWVRNFLRTLASEGRTVFVSSHMLSEMALTADELIVIGKGKLIAATSVAEFTKNAAQTTTIVRSEHLTTLADALTTEGLNHHTDTDPQGRPTLIIPDQETDYIGQLAYTYGIPLLELSQHQGSLEDAFIASTGHTAQYTTLGENSPRDKQAAQGTEGA